MSSPLFFRTFAGDPYWNMAFDEWLLSRALAEPGALFLRLYTWSVGTITFGCNQRLATALDFSRAGDTPVIRRVTGGRALYHDLSEFTYAVAADTRSSPSPELSGGLAKSSEAVAVALAAFLKRLQIDAAYVRASAAADSRPEVFHKAPCFASAAKYELVADGRKVVASAQKRQGAAFLQHGAIKVSGVAAHPALAAGQPDSPATLQPVDVKMFSRTAAIFERALGPILHVTFAEGKLSRADEKELQRMAAELKKNCLLKRVIIAHTRGDASL